MSQSRYLPHFIAFFIFTAVLMSSWMVMEYKKVEDRQQKYQAILTQLNHVGILLENTISNNSLVADLLTANLKAKSYQIDVAEFNAIAHEFMLARKEIRSIHFAPDAFNEFIYPPSQTLEGNHLNSYKHLDEQGLLNYPAKYRFFLTGPETLLHEGKAFVIRMPIFPQDDIESGVRGVVTIVIDLNAILKQSGLLNQTGEIYYALRKINTKGNTTYISGKRVLFELDSIIKKLELFNLQLDIAAFPRQGWNEENWKHNIIVLSGIIAALFISSLSFVLMRTPVYLQQRIKASSLELKNKSRELKLAQQWHESLIDTTPDLIFYKDAHGKYITCNQAFAAYLGFNKNDIIGKTDEELLPHEMAGFFHLVDENYLKNPEYQHNEEWISTNYGKTLTLDTIKMPVFDDNNELLGVFGISRDNNELGHCQ